MLVKTVLLTELMVRVRKVQSSTNKSSPPSHATIGRAVSAPLVCHTAVLCADAVPGITETSLMYTTLAIRNAMVSQGSPCSTCVCYKITTTTPGSTDHDWQHFNALHHKLFTCCVVARFNNLICPCTCLLCRCESPASPHVRYTSALPMSIARR